MNRLKIFYCKTCGSVAVAYGNPTMQCCGENLAPVTVRPCSAEPAVTPMDGEYLLECDSPMTKEDYIAAVVVERYDRVELLHLFPEQAPQVRVAQVKGARIIVLRRQLDTVWAEEYKA